MGVRLLAKTCPTSLVKLPMGCCQLRLGVSPSSLTCLMPRPSAYLATLHLACNRSVLCVTPFFVTVPSIVWPRSCKNDPEQSSNGVHAQVSHTPHCIHTAESTNDHFLNDQAWDVTWKIWRTTITNNAPVEREIDGERSKD